MFVGYYLPGFKSGGPVRTISNMVEWLGDEFDFKIITSNCDLGDTKPYPKQGLLDAEVLYVSQRDMTFKNLRRYIFGINPNLIYFPYP